jgi:hypothetical protein
MTAKLKDRNQPILVIEAGMIKLKYRTPERTVKLRDLVLDKVLAGMPSVEARLVVCELETIASIVRNRMDAKVSHET